MGEQNKWIMIDDRLPDKSGQYAVLWSYPYSENMCIGMAYFNGERFGSSPSGANEILFWLEADIPEVDEKIRQRLCKLTKPKC